MIKIVNSYEEANCITHNGTMHADEVFATAFLHQYMGDLRVYRVSDVDWSKVNKDTIVYDIGRREFDHHQLDAVKRDNGITYSSIGLLWKEYGKDYLEKEGYSNVDQLFQGVDRDLIEAIDADDNGFFPKIEANYKVKTLSNVIKLFNPGFESGENESNQFIKAVEVAEKIFYEDVVYIYGKIKADIKVQSIMKEVTEEDKYLILDEFLPYEDSIISNPKYNNMMFVAFPSNRGGYAIKALPKSSEDKSNRMLFPKEWGGLTNEELEEVSGIKGLRFCHSACFIVNCKTLETVKEVLNKLCQ